MIYLVSHILKKKHIYRNKQKTECVGITSLEIHLEQTPSPLSMVHTTASKIMLYFFFSPPHSPRSSLSRIDKEVNIAAGGLVTS